MVEDHSTAKRLEKQVKHVPGVPDVPTANGHYMGQRYGFEYAGGKYHIAPAMYHRMEEVLTREDGLCELIAAINKHFANVFTELMSEKKECFERMFEEYGLKGEDGWAYRRTGILFKPAPKEQK